MDLPLEFRSDFSTHGFRVKDRYIDLYQSYVLMRNAGRVELLHPDGATKLFSSYYNNERFGVFESFLTDISRSGFRLFHLIRTMVEIAEETYEQRTQLRQYDPRTRKFTIVTKSSKIPLDATNTIIMIEYGEEDVGFGHYGACYISDIKPKIISIYDSMMYAESADIEATSDYLDLFIALVSKYFNTEDFDFEPDYYPGGYSCELTGGSLGLKNDYITKANGSLEWTLDNYVMGVDNQNQFCYMWTILYIVSKTAGYRHPDVDFLNIHRLMYEHKIIPVAFIKTFISYTFCIDYIRDNFSKLLRNDFFHTFFGTITSNGTNYNDVFNTENTAFTLCKVSTIDIEGKKDTYTSIYDAFAAFVLIIPTIKVQPLVNSAGEPFTLHNTRLLSIVSRIVSEFINQSDKKSKSIFSRILSNKRFIKKDNLHELYKLNKRYEDQERYKITAKIVSTMTGGGKKQAYRLLLTF
jgi:hypothetical protein